MKRSGGLKRDGAKAREFAERGRGKLGVDARRFDEFIERGRAASARSLRADEARLREFAARAQVAGAESLRKSARKGRAKTAARRKESEGPLSPAQWRAAAYNASGGLCIITGTRAYGLDDPSFDAHHPLPKRELRARGLFAFVWDPRNAVWLAELAHGRQEAAFVRVAGELLPAPVWEFCAELDARDGSEWATALVERMHPATGSQSRQRSRRA